MSIQAGLSVRFGRYGQAQQRILKYAKASDEKLVQMENVMRIQAPARFGGFNAYQQQVMKHLKSPEPEFLDIFSKVAQGVDISPENDSLAVIGAAVKRLEVTTKPDFIRKMEQLLSNAVGNNIRGDLFDAFSSAYARLFQGAPRL